MSIRQITIVGTGLIGGSLGLALRERKFTGRIVGCDREAALAKVENLFDRKFLGIAGAILGCLSIMFGAVTFLKDHRVSGTALGWVALLGGLAILIVVYLLARKPKG